MMLSSCGGGGSDCGSKGVLFGASACVNLNSNQSQTPLVSSTNPNAAFSNLMIAQGVSNSWTSTTSSPAGYISTVFTQDLPDQLYGKQGALLGPARVLKLQMNIQNISTGVIIQKNIYKFHLDKITGTVIGIAGTYNDTVSFCLNTTTMQNSLPTTANINDSGNIIEGLEDLYFETSRSGITADYCQNTFLPPAPVSAQLKWSFEADAKSSYFCLKDFLTNSILASICFGVDGSGNITKSIRTRIYGSSDSPLIEASN